MQSDDDQYGLKWVHTRQGALEPEWSVEFNEAAITVIAATAHAALRLSRPCTATPFTRGQIYKSYVISSADLKEDVIARVILSIKPKWKTESEVATMQWVCENTSLPVPRVLAYNSNRKNPLGFEWIITEKVPGKPWADVWKEIDFPAKARVVRQVALFAAEAYRRQMRGIGSLVMTEDVPTSSDTDQASRVLKKDHADSGIPKLPSKYSLWRPVWPY